MEDFQQDSNRESEEVLLKESTAFGKQVKFNRQLGQMPWCCKHAWPKSEKCRLAYCMKCKPVMMATVENTKQGG